MAYITHVRKIFRDRMKVTVYVEAEDLIRLTERSRGEGKLLAEWAREVLLGEIGEEAVQGVVSEKPAKGATATVGAGTKARQERELPHDRATGKYSGAMVQGESKEKTCPHGVKKDWRCTLCGGVVK